MLTSARRRLVVTSAATAVIITVSACGTAVPNSSAPSSQPGQAAAAEPYSDFPTSWGTRVERPWPVFDVSQSLSRKLYIIYSDGREFLTIKPEFACTNGQINSLGYNTSGSYEGETQGPYWPNQFPTAVSVDGIKPFFLNGVNIRTNDSGIRSSKGDKLVDRVGNNFLVKQLGTDVTKPEKIAVGCEAVNYTGKRTIPYQGDSRYRPGTDKKGYPQADIVKLDDSPVTTAAGKSWGFWSTLGAVSPLNRDKQEPIWPQTMQGKFVVANTGDKRLSMQADCGAAKEVTVACQVTRIATPLTNGNYDSDSGNGLAAVGAYLWNLPVALKIVNSTSLPLSASDKVAPLPNPKAKMEPSGLIATQGVKLETPWTGLSFTATEETVGFHRVFDNRSVPLTMTESEWGNSKTSPPIDSLSEVKPKKFLTQIRFLVGPPDCEGAVIDRKSCGTLLLTVETTVNSETGKLATITVSCAQRGPKAIATEPGIGDFRIDGTKNSMGPDGLIKIEVGLKSKGSCARVTVPFDDAGNAMPARR